MMFPEGKDVHPAALVTVNEYVPGCTPTMVVLVPLPLVLISPGYLVRFHVPVPGSPFRVMLPVGKIHEG